MISQLLYFLNNIKSTNPELLREICGYFAPSEQDVGETVYISSNMEYSIELSWTCHLQKHYFYIHRLDK